MTLKPFFLSLVVLAVVQLVPFACAQEVDGSDLRREVREREERINKLSIEEQLRLRAAQQKAAEDPAVKAALEKRNKAIQEFRAALRASMIKADPTVEPILDKVAIPAKRGP
jgi:membrane protein involved in colicin uptake